MNNKLNNNININNLNLNNNLINNKNNNYLNIINNINNKIKENYNLNINKKGVLNKIENTNIETKETEIKFCIEKPPENYVRERSGRGKHFYNPKSDKMKEYKKIMIHQMEKEVYEYTRELIKNENATYYIYLEATYYYPIPKGDSAYMKILKENGVLKPDIRIDLDNYDKFLLDSLHDVVYDDDKRVVSIKSDKKYSLVPRTDVTIKILELKI